MSELVESFAIIQVSKDAPEFTQVFIPITKAPETINPPEVPEANVIPEANP